MKKDDDELNAEETAAQKSVNIYFFALLLLKFSPLHRNAEFCVVTKKRKVKKNRLKPDVTKVPSRKRKKSTLNVNRVLKMFRLKKRYNVL